METIASALLAFAHELFGPGIWPGDWVWATTTAGLLIGLLPVLGAMTVAVIRKGTGNRYDAVMMTVIGVIGALTVLVLPALLANGVSETYRDVFAGNPNGLPTFELAPMAEQYALIGQQSAYLGGGPSVYEILFYPSGDTVRYGYYLGMLVGLPALSLVFIMLQARIALRRGPKWPGRFFWVPLLGYCLATVAVEANTAVHLWLGFLLASVLGLIPIALLGPPPWSRISNSGSRGDRRGQRDRPPEPERREIPAGQSQHAAPVDPPPPRGQYRPTAVASSAEQAPEPSGQLAAAPGPIPVPGGSKSAGSSRYRRTRQLGSGGFGTVWEAVDTQLGRTVALKIAHAPDRDTEQRMEREARALAALNHPNCVRVYDLAEEPDGLALVMEYLHGQPLARTVDVGGPLADVQAGRLWATTASALSAAHDNGVLHRDVKPSNVILDPGGIPHLIDFGIARAKGDATLTASGMMIGTPDYVAPETAEGAPASPASDAWQLAATVSFALSGYPPRGTRETPMAALMAAARAEPPTYLPRRSVHAKLLIASLDPQPRNRPTLRAVCQEVEGWLGRAGEPVDGPVTTVVPRVT